MADLQSRVLIADSGFCDALQTAQTSVLGNFRDNSSSNLDFCFLGMLVVCRFIRFSRNGGFVSIINSAFGICIGLPGKIKGRNFYDSYWYSSHNRLICFSIGTVLYRLPASGSYDQSTLLVYFRETIHARLPGKPVRDRSFQYNLAGKDPS